MREEGATSSKMEATSKEILGIMSLMASESTSISQDINMKVSGKTICLMERGRLLILTAVATTVNSSITEGMEKVFSCKKELFFKVLLSKINSKEKESWKVITDKDIEAFGRKISNMEKGSIFGRMETAIEESTETAYEMELEL